MSDYFDALETRDPADRQAALFADLAALIAHAQSRAPAYARLLAGIDAATVTSPLALAALPVTRKAELIEAQRADPPFAGLTATPQGHLARIFSSPGPIYDPQGRLTDWWRFARALFAAGFRAGDLVHNCFSYHFTPAGSMVESGAEALGCPVFAGGTGQSEQQARAIADLRPAGYAGTPSFLKTIVDKGDELGLDTRSLTKALVSGEYLSLGLRQEFAARGIAVRQCYATADLGLIAYESHAMDGLILDEKVIVEILRPGTGDPVVDGEVGEVVVTSFNRDYPLIRFATGDLSAVLAGPSPCGRTNRRIKGWMGRADQTVKIKGMFVHPSQIGDIVKRHGEIKRARLVVEKANDGDAMILHIETIAPEIAAAVAESLRSVTKLRGSVVAVPPGSLPNDGKVIEDKRPAPGS